MNTPRALAKGTRLHVRRAQTDYGQCLARGMERAEARAAVRSKVEQVLEGWRGGAWT